MNAIPPHLQHEHHADATPPLDEAGWNAIYAGRPGWEIGRPQPAFAALAERGGIRGRVLDVGCGTGEHVLMCAELGLSAVGVDLSSVAIEAATQKARVRGLDGDFCCYDVTHLDELDDQFDTVLDCGLFVHLVDDEDDRAAFLDGLRAVVRPGGQYIMLCFRTDGGHHRALTRDEIETLFADGWRLDEIEPTMIEGAMHADGLPGWLAILTRI